MIIVNADDLGYSKDINSAIIESFNRSICSSTTIMANAEHFAEACQLLMENKLLHRTGIHMVLVEGQPLTDEIKKYPRFCDNTGMFHTRRKKLMVSLNSDEKIAVAKELRSQIAYCRKCGIPLTHADSHQHMHEEWALAEIFIQVCREDKIPYLRPARNCGVITARLKRIYRNMLNSKFRKAGLAKTDFFGSAADFKFYAEQMDAWDNTISIEVMVHPCHKDNVLIDATDEKPLAELTELLNRTEKPVPFNSSLS